MTFGEKLREQRKKAGISQGVAAKAVGVTKRTMANYEGGNSYPQDRSVYFRLADYFGVDVNYFLTENEEFLTAVAESYGKRGQDQAAAVLEMSAALFAGGELSENDREAFIRNMQQLFLESKEIARKRFMPKKYRNMSGSKLNV